MSKIKQIQVFALRAPAQVRPHWTAHFVVPTGNEILVKLKTESGVEGFGLCTHYTNNEHLIQPWKTGFEQLILEEDALCPERLYQKLFNLTTSKVANQKGWAREAIIRLSAAVDIACWDILGKTANLPLYKIFGGHRNKVDVYATCGYYRDGKDNEELRDELQMMMDQGNKAFKIKTGGLELHEDIKRLEFIRDVIGFDKDLMIDVNRAWSIKTALQALPLLEPLKPRWLEEPCRWEDDRRAASILAKRTNIPISGGESEISSFGCRSYIEERAIQILQFDVTMYGGFTEGKKMMGLCELNHVDVAPHHDCFIHAHLVASSSAGIILESFSDPERDPLQAELFSNPMKIENGVLTLNEEPGLGLTISPEAMEKYATRIL